MRLKGSLIIAVFSFALISHEAAAGWVQDAWDEAKVRDHPSITLRAPDIVLVTFTQKALQDAQEQGLDLDQAVKAFVDWYAPKQCRKEPYDFSQPIHGLRVEVFMQHQSDLYDRSSDMRSGANAAREYLDKNPGPQQRGKAFIEETFTVAKEGKVISIEYAPAREIRCVMPEMTPRELKAQEELQRHIREHPIVKPD